VGLATVTLLLTGAVPMASAAPFAYMANMSSGTVSVVDAADPARPQVVGLPITVGFLPVDVAVNPAGTFAYVANFGDNTLSVINTADRVVTATIPVGAMPNAVAVNPTGTTVYVATGVGTISVVDAASLAVTHMTGFGNLMGIAINRAGTRLYVTDANAPHALGSGSVFSIDLSGATAPVQIPIGDSPMGVAVNPSGTRVYAVGTDPMTDMGAVWVINAETNALEATVGVGDGPIGVTVNATGSLVYVASASDNTVSVIYSRTNDVVEVVQLGGTPHGVAVDSKGAHVFIGNSPRTGTGRVCIMNAASNTVIANAEVGIGPASIGAFVTDGPVQSPSGDQVAALQKLLDAANETIATLTAQLEALQTANLKLQSLLDAANVTIARLKSEYEHSNETLASFIRRLMTGRTDANVAAAARAAAQEQLTRATAAKGTRDWRIKHAQKEIDRGNSEMAAGRHHRAVRDFGEAYDICWRLLRS
jgi:YVTN family beta-propeller protein